MDFVEKYIYQSRKSHSGAESTTTSDMRRLKLLTYYLTIRGHQPCEVGVLVCNKTAVCLEMHVSDSNSTLHKVWVLLLDTVVSGVPECLATASR